ncbi:hypothetical protein TWF970_004869 [Orbilia oligospora]|uniref:Nucleoside phosphorylase domain-containing protein n=1 Tax=Orbilia oligospora TaxID=2813651 RepID=A0A7C8V5I9_ORBOL|nr:hypothetical protein TWF970_004869 [Orbilia oligospora]
MSRASVCESTLHHRFGNARAAYTMAPKPDTFEYTVAMVCALALEMAATTAMLDEVYGKPEWQDPRDKNNYTLGRIGQHYVVIACLPEGVYGMTAATSLITWMISSFRNIKFALIVGIGGGVPSVSHDIRLGDVVVSKPRGTSPGIVQYDFGKAVNGEIIANSSLDMPPKVLLTAMSSLAAGHMMTGNKISIHVSKMLERYPRMKEKFSYPGTDKDLLYEADYGHTADTPTCDQCDSGKLKGEDFSVSIDQNFNEFVGACAKSSPVFKKALAKLFLPPSTKGVEGDIQIMSKQSSVYTLLQPRTLFKNISSTTEFQDWLGDAWARRKPLYFVVGYRTVTDAQFIGKEIKSPQNRRLSRNLSYKPRYDTDGERIYAICFRKVKFERTSEGTVQVLGSTNRWRVFNKQRGANSELEQVISADLCEDDEVGTNDFGVFPTQNRGELWTGF